MELKKYKVCPSCGEHNRPTSLECRKCETDLTGVRVVDSEIEQREAEKVATENTGTTGADVPAGPLVRVCEECGAENAPQARKCKQCGEDISDILRYNPSKVSTVADIVVQDFEEAAKLEKMVIAILNSKSSECRNSTMHFQYLEYENKVRITLWGDLVFVRNVLDAISIILEQTDK